MTLSELVAVEVMGWHTIEGGWGKWYDSQGHHVVLPCYWQPDTNIADAWRVVEKMHDYCPEIESNVREGVRCTMWIQPDVSVYAVEDTAPRAIVVCALRACGVSEDRIEQARKGNA